MTESGAGWETIYILSGLDSAYTRLRQETLKHNQGGQRADFTILNINTKIFSS